VGGELVVVFGEVIVVGIIGEGSLTDASRVGELGEEEGKYSQSGLTEEVV